MSSLQSSFIRFMLRRSKIWNEPLLEIRKTMESMKAEDSPSGIQILQTDLKGVPCYTFFHSREKSKKVILYFHGGGFCLGIYNANREFVAKIADRTKFDAFMPDYRLAPENPFPAALDDAIAVYKGLLENGYRADDIVIAGDSSGCALALSAILVLKQSGYGMPSMILCITPVFDLAGKGATYTTKAKKDPFQLIDPLGIAKNYVSDNNSTSPLLSPLYGELEGLPPIFIHAAEYDVFLSDATRFAEKAKESKVKVEIKIWDKMWHIFPMQEKVVPESKLAMNELCSQIK